MDESSSSNSSEIAIEIKNERFVEEEYSPDVKYSNQIRGNQMNKTGEEKGGFGQGIKLDKILGDVLVNYVRYFLVKWKNSLDKGQF